MNPPYPTVNLTTTADFKARNPSVDVSSWTDATLSGMISMVTRKMLNFCQVDSFTSISISGERSKTVITPAGDLVIFPRVRPIQEGSVSAIRLVKGGFSTSLTLSGSGSYFYQVPYPYTSLNYPSSYLAGVGTLMIGGSTQLVTLRGASTYCEIDYTGGYSTPPEDLVDACDLWIRDMCARRLNPMGAQEVRQGTFSFSRQLRSSGQGSNIIDTMLVQEAKEILSTGGYRRTVIGE